jgi:hypothetical protein
MWRRYRAWTKQLNPLWGLVFGVLVVVIGELIRKVT